MICELQRIENETRVYVLRHAKEIVLKALHDAQEVLQSGQNDVGGLKEVISVIDDRILRATTQRRKL